jgi:hypothetical protein
VSNTDKQNFRYPTEVWRRAVAKCAEMREHGYDIDMTRLLAAEVDRFLDEPCGATAERLGLAKADKPVPAYRRPAPRAGVA